MAAKKPSWKIAAVDRLIVEQRAQIAALEALPTRPACRACWGAPAHEREANPRCERCGGDGTRVDTVARAKRLKHAHARLRELKNQKRRPGSLLTLAQLLRDEASLARAQRFPHGSEHMLAALETERARIIEQHGSVSAHFAHHDRQKQKAAKLRVKGDGGLTIGELVKKLARENPRDTPPLELWPSLAAAIAAEYGDCVEEAGERGPLYRYRPWIGGKRGEGTITYKYFRQLLGSARRARRR